MEFFKRYQLQIPLILALVIAMFPDSFKKIGEKLMEWVLSANRTDTLLITIVVILLFICKQCWTIKEQNSSTQKKKNSL